jgi:hypothetical protein
MSLFGPILDSGVLEEVTLVGAEVVLSSGVNNVSGQGTPLVGAGKIIAPAAGINNTSGINAPIVVTGKLVAISGPFNSVSANPNMQAVSTSATITVTAPATNLSGSNPPDVRAGTGIFIITGVNSTSAVNAPAIASGKRVSFASPVNNTSANPNLQAVSTSAQVTLTTGPNSLSASFAPVLAAGVNIFVGRTELSVDTGSILAGGVLEFEIFGGTPSAVVAFLPVRNRSQSNAPEVVAGSGISPLNPVNSFSESWVPEIDTERQRKQQYIIAS